MSKFLSIDVEYSMSAEVGIAIIFFLLGIIFGSFYNVVIYRLPMNMSIVKGRSMCFACKHRLGLGDLFPLASYLFLGGRCRYCRAKISMRYFVIELATGLLFLLAYLRFGLSVDALIMVVFWSMLLVVAIIDVDTMSIYDIVLWVFSGINLILIFFGENQDIKLQLLGAIIGFIIYLAIYLLAKLIYKKEAFGFGDVLLNAAIGLILGFPDIIWASFFAFLVGMVFILGSMLVGRQPEKMQEIPFGPYMCISALIFSAYGQDIISFYYQYFLRV